MNAVSVLLYGIFTGGVILFAGRDINVFIKGLFLRKRLGKSIGAEKRSGFMRLIEMLLSANFQKNELSPESFIALMIMMFSLVFLLCIRTLNLFTSLFSSAAVSLLPVLLLYVRMEAERTKNSKEGISMVTEFYRQYRMKNLNVYEALEATVSAEGDFPGCKKQLYKLLLKLRASANQTEIRRSIDDFSFSLGTVWGKMFATCIDLSAERGDDVSAGLADIIEQLKTAGELAEDRKRLNSEAARMTMYLVPVLYIGTMLLAIYYLDVSPQRLFANQFLTPEGMIFFMVTVCLFVFNLILLKMIDNTRLDY